MARATAFATMVVVASLAPLGCGGQQANSGGASSTTSSGNVGAGATAPDFTAMDTQGNTIRLSDYLGKTAVLLDFCATWCEPCVAEFPHLRKTADARRGQLQIIAIAMDGPETIANVPAFAQRNQLNFPMVTDDDSLISALYNPKKSAPLTVLIDKQGKIVSMREGFNPGDENYLEKQIAQVLDGAPATQ